MTFLVEVTTNGKHEAETAYEWLAERTSHAVEWFNGLVDAIQGLELFPTRCGLARESDDFDEPIRQLLYGTKPNVYRILFIVRENVVYVLHVRHAAREPLKWNEVAFPRNSTRGEWRH